MATRIDGVERKPLILGRVVTVTTKSGEVVHGQIGAVANFGEPFAELLISDGEEDPWIPWAEIAAIR